MGRKPVQLGLKRAMDFALASISLVALAIPFLIIGALIKRDSRGPVFFRQERIGKDGRPFRIWKFRTMVNHDEKQGPDMKIASDDDRITRFGSLLRERSLDELPQLINVARGELSLVGPRPTLRYQVELYDDFQRQRLLAKPGITSWAVVNGRNMIPWNERIKLDVWYVRHWSLWLDIKIIFRTLWIAFVTRKGIYGPGGANDNFISSRGSGSQGDSTEAVSVSGQGAHQIRPGV